METNELTRKKVKLFFDNNISVHISLQSKEFLNGKIASLDDEEYFFLNERKLGLMPVLYEDVFTIRPLEELKNGN